MLSVLGLVASALGALVDAEVTLEVNEEKAKKKELSMYHLQGRRHHRSQQRDWGKHREASRRTGRESGRSAAVERIDAVVQEISATGGKAIGFVTDVTKRGEVEALIQGAIDGFGRVDVLLNSAGIMPIAPIQALKVRREGTEN